MRGEVPFLGRIGVCGPSPGLPGSLQGYEKRAHRAQTEALCCPLLVARCNICGQSYRVACCPLLDRKPSWAGMGCKGEEGARSGLG